MGSFLFANHRWTWTLLLNRPLSATNKHSPTSVLCNEKMMQGAFKCLCLNWWRTGQKERKREDMRGEVVSHVHIHCQNRPNNSKFVQFFSKRSTNVVECMSVILLHSNHLQVLCPKHVSSFFLCSTVLEQVFGMLAIHCEWARYRQHTEQVFGKLAIHCEWARYRQHTEQVFGMLAIHCEWARYRQHTEHLIQKLTTCEEKTKNMEVQTQNTILHCT
jgi:hypothetical protein